MKLSPFYMLQVGMETFRMCRSLLDGVILVDNSAISAAIKDVFNETRSILEPAGAVAVAGAKAYLSRQGLKVAHPPSDVTLSLAQRHVAAPLIYAGGEVMGQREPAWCSIQDPWGHDVAMYAVLQGQALWDV